MRIHSFRWSNVVLLGALSACGDDAANVDSTVDVTAGNAANIVQDTAAQVESAIEQHSTTLDAAIEAQSNGAAAE